MNYHGTRYSVWLLAVLSLSLSVLGAADRDSSRVSYRTPHVITIGLLQGGSIIGLDWEYRYSEKLGAVVGTGVGGYNIGILYHLSDGTRGNMLGLAYRDQMGSYELLAIELIRRFGLHASRGFSAQLGVGFVLSMESDLQEIFEDELGEVPAIMPTFAMGWSF